MVAQELRATNDGLNLGCALSFWRTRSGQEVDFVLYGERGLVAIEVKRSQQYNSRDLVGLRTFDEDYPMADRYLFYGGTREYEVDGIRVVPLAQALARLPEISARRHRVFRAVLTSARLLISVGRSRSTIN